MGNVTAKTSGDIASFMTPAETNIKSLKVHFSPKQLGEGDPSPENVREIVGWDGVEVNGCGKNLINLNTIKQEYRVNIQGEVVRAATYCLTDYIPVFSSSKYYLSNAGTLAANACTAFYDKNKELLNTTRNITPIITPNDCAYIRCSFKIENIDIVQLELSSIATSYEPYQGNNISTDWSSDVGTVYGGYVDLISGELVEEYHGFIADGENIKANSGYRSTSTNTAGGGFVYILNKDYPSLPDGKNTNNIYCDKLISKNVGSQKNCLYHASNGQLYFVAYVLDINEDNITTNTEAKDKTNEWLKSNLLQIVYELKTPITHQLTPTQLQSFVGQNNFWSNADYVEIEYELKETEDIQKARKKIILNQPHIESVKDDLVNFITNMKAPLKECKVYFNPIQEGSGDPSPDNVRNIVGWDGINVGLPDEYQEVEWIKSNGAQFIQLPFGFDDTDEIETVFSIEQPANDKYINSPSVWNNNGNRFGMGKHTGQGGLGQTFTAAYGTRMTGYTYLEPPTNPDYDLHKWTYQNHVFAIPELEISRDVSDIGFGGTTANLKLFYGYNTNTIGKISYYKHIKSDATYHLIACYRKSDNEIGLYDIINNVFYTNDGTDAFAKGADVNNITTNISWSDEVGTVYGGYVDLAKGELVAEYESVSAPWSEWTFGENLGNNTRKVYSTIHKSIGGNAQDTSLCNLTNNYLWNNSNDIPHFYVANNGNSLYAILSNTLDENQEVQISYKLAEPIYYQLTPQQLLTFKGTNNIWSNSNGQTEVKFWTH